MFTTILKKIVGIVNKEHGLLSNLLVLLGIVLVPKDAYVEKQKYINSAKRTSAQLDPW